MLDRILVVEDDRDFSLQLSSLLEFNGFEVDTATTGAKGLERFAEQPADLVLLDLMLPDSHGFSVLERLRELPGGADVPAVLISAVYERADLGARDQARLGVLAFLTRPFSLNELGRQVRGILEREEKGRESVRVAMASTRRSPDQAGLDLVSGPMAHVPDFVAEDFAEIDDEDDDDFATPGLPPFEVAAGEVDIEDPDEDEQDDEDAGAFAPPDDPDPAEQGAADDEDAGAFATLDDPEPAEEGGLPAPPFWLSSLDGEDAPEVEFEIEVSPSTGAPPPREAAKVPAPAPPWPPSPAAGSADLPALLRLLVAGRPNDPRLWTRTMVGLHVGRLAGRLSLRDGERVRTLLLLNGYPVWVQVEPFSDGLPAWLVSQGQLEPHKGAKFVELHEKKGWSIARTLLALKHFEPEDVDELLQTWVADEVRAGFDRAGVLRWTPGDDFAGSVPVFESNPVRCIWPCVRSIRLGRLELELAHREGARLVRTPAALRILDCLPESDEAARLQANLATPRAWQELLAGSREQREKTLRLLWLLEHGGGLIESEEAVPAATPSPRSDIETGRIPRSLIESLRNEIDDQEAQITADWLEKMGQLPRAFLGTPAGASASDVRQAYRDLGERWRVSGGEAFSRPDTARKAKELTSRLRQAFQAVLAEVQSEEA